MDDLAEPVARGAFRVLIWSIRLVLEALFDYVIEKAWEISKRRYWIGWIPSLVPAVVGAILARLAWADGQPWVSLILLAAFIVPAAGRAIYIAIVPASLGRG
jgi:hypothetical protein